MNRFTIIFLLLMILLTLGVICTKTTHQRDFKGPYLGQKPPGLIPRVFAPGFVSTQTGELGIIISPDGKEIYFCRSKQGRPTTIFCSRQHEGKWTRPQAVSFSGTHSDMDPSMTPDGREIFFGSNRPTDNPKARGCDLWKVSRKSSQESWSDPVRLNSPVNTLQNENYPVTTSAGTLYFLSEGLGGEGKLDIFKSEYQDGRYLKPENLGKAINSKYHDFDPFIAPDESYIIFSSNGRPDGYGSGDLYISIKEDNGSWTKARNLGPDINSDKMDYCPKVTPDGKYLFFTSGRTGNGDIYWVDAKILNKYLANQ